MYSTSVSECFVPDMNVTAETSGQSPCARTTSSAPSPLSVVMMRRLREAPLERGGGILEARSAFVATIPRSNGWSSSGSRDAVTVAWRSLRPGHAEARRG